jgi:rod shape-determining protein MreD
MRASRRLPPLAEKALFLGLGYVTVTAGLIPLGPGGGITFPDLLYGLVVAWIIRRPATAPASLVLLLGLFADVMWSRPLGLGALGLLLVSEVFRARAPRLQGTPFLVEWLAAAVGFAAMLAGMQLALKLVFAPTPALDGLVDYLLVTVLAYPLVVLGLTWCLRLGAPNAGELPGWPR